MYNITIHINVSHKCEFMQNSIKCVHIDVTKNEMYNCMNTRKMNF